MSELKGQLFGIILVILMSVAIGGAIKKIVNDNVSAINSQEAAANSAMNANT